MINYFRGAQAQRSAVLSARHWLAGHTYYGLEHVRRPGILKSTLPASLGGLFAATSLAASTPSNSLPPTPAREFRGAWVATVSNIDWPSKPGLPSDQQKAELIAILDQAVKLKLNAVLFQVRPACDALYPSALEPWSEYLTGQMGKAPNAFYDPLALAIEEAHRRGLELHAWFNPFRARHASGKAPVAPDHVSKTHPQWVKSYGKQLWLDPADMAAQEYSSVVILDVVKRYDVDGIHLDDYFYPYQEKLPDGRWLDFPDEANWKRYVAGGGKLSRPDWRRENVNQFVRNLYRSIKSIRPWVKFGISPFGIWRPGHPGQIKGLDAYDQLYADSRKWLANGWVDYFAPQLYWSIESPGQSYPVLLKWWLEQNTQHRHLWPGNNSAKVRSQAWPANQIIEQVRLTRTLAAGGNIHWNASSLMPTSPLGPALAQGPYAGPALVPASPWLDQQPPGKPAVNLAGRDAQGRIKISWEPTGPEKVWLWVIQTRRSGRWETRIVPAQHQTETLSGKGATALPGQIAVSAVDRCGNLSVPTLANVP